MICTPLSSINHRRKSKQQMKNLSKISATTVHGHYYSYCYNYKALPENRDHTGRLSSARLSEMGSS